MPDFGSVDASELESVAVTSLVVSSTTGLEATQAANETRVLEVTFTPTRPPVGVSQEVFGTVSLMESSFGAIEFVDGTRVQHTHDRAVYRLMEDLVNELRELRELRNERSATS